MDELVCAPCVEEAEASCQVRLNDMEVMADIGVYESEQGMPQPLLIDVAVTVLPPSRDDLSHTFDYTRVRAYALELAGQRIALIETFALRLARLCLAEHGVLQAEVRIGKPRAVPGCLASTCVTLRKDKRRF
ncbi:dihydroneopterin aldolase [Caballeronia sp. LZ065]|uniref:dihydroneopterin aldolase n=1 Tax=Caballeronia sp. LZ065 TaxID=3038571 RepID=UPI00285BF21C|nr:dihydroneopterin aldolase [Caballeronia sp. LZ065]MDR5783845.1 dihydroneopterin aldolase [Caballeronia sp. LZ065]